MTWLTTKRIKRSSHSRCLRRGLERLERRNLLAADLMQEDTIMWSGSSEMILRSLAWGGDETVQEDNVDAEVFDDGTTEEVHVIYFGMLSSDAADDQAPEGDTLDGDLTDGNVIFYSMALGDPALGDDVVDLEVVPGEDTVKFDEMSDGGEIRTFGGVGSDDPEALAYSSGMFMSDWYNPNNPLDANGDVETSPLDTLITFNSLAALGSVQLSHSLFALSAFGAAVDADFMVDASNDGFLSPLDALLRVNFLAQWEQSSGSTDTSSDAADDQGGFGAFAATLPVNWDDSVPADDGLVWDDDSLLEDSGDAQPNVFFGARIRDPSLDLQDDTSDDTSGDPTAVDEFWSDFGADESDSPLDDGTLDSLVHIY